MNNDISNGLNRYGNSNSPIRKTTETDFHIPSTEEDKKISKAETMSYLDYLEAMGNIAQVNMCNSGIKKSVDTYVKDPLYAQTHVGLCDSFVEDGIPLEKAIENTDNILNILSNEETYNE